MKTANLRIVFDCGWGGPSYDWGPWCCDRGLGGSEECVIYLANALVHRGHDVTVVNRCGLVEPRRIEGVWYQTPDHPPLENVDLYVAWRNWHLVTNTPAAHRCPAKTWLWCHDIPVGDHFPQRPDLIELFNAFVDKVVVLNGHHRRLYAAVPDEKAFVCPIGIVAEQFEQPAPERIPGRVIYCSHPHRGLHKLREAWPAIKEKAPHATLAAFWWEPEHFHAPVPELGILPMRSCGHAELARELMSAEVFAYPSVFHAEISPATCIKAQAAGAVPVYVPAGGMSDVIKYGHPADAETFAGAVANALNDPAWQESQRQPMMTWARSRYNWQAVAEKWEEQYYRQYEPGTLSVA